MRSAPASFWEWLATSHMSSGQQAELFMFALFIICSTLVVIASIVSFTVYRVHRNRLADALKRELLDRGLSTEEIVELVYARPVRKIQTEELEPLHQA